MAAQGKTQSLYGHDPVDAHGTPELQTADKLAPGGAPLVPVESELVVAPEMSLEQSKAVWNKFLELKGFILDDPTCYDVIAGRREMNRTGATRLALPFGLSMEERQIDETQVTDAEDGSLDHRYIVRVRVSKGGRFADGIGSCRLSEIAEKTAKGEPVPVSQREHFALTRASTRARKRAIADILGGTEAE